MKNYLKYFHSIIKVLVGITLTVLILYGIYWVIKTASYVIFYEDMVEGTITQRVKPEALNNEK